MLKRFLAFCLLLPLTAFANMEGPNKLPAPGTVALTFNDGPSPVYTRKILAILKKHHVKATFFVVGTNARKYPDLIRQIHAQGHVIALHTMSHASLNKLSDTSLQAELATPIKIIDSLTGTQPQYMRYPFGASNEHVGNEIRKYGLVPVSMGFNAYDHERPGTDQIVNWVLNNAYSRQIILLHDGPDKREQTVAALPRIIEGIKKKGLGFSTICA